MKRVLLFVLILAGHQLFAQKLPDFGLDRVRIVQPDKTIQADLKPLSSEPSIETSATYYWYSANAIHTTQGGFSGRLLNGLYTEYYPNKNLKEQGLFKKGLKTGVWKSWADTGILMQAMSWSNGIKSGTFFVYDEQGNVKQSGHYRDGQVVAKSTAPSFWQKINIFKRHPKTSTTTDPAKK